MFEEWRIVPSKPGLMASSLGRIVLPKRRAQMPHGGWRDYNPEPTFGVVRSAKKGAAHRYFGVFAMHYGNIKVHQAVCEAFHGPRPFPNAVVIHLNENGLDNSAGNLKWKKKKENLNAERFIQYRMARKPERAGFVAAKIMQEDEFLKKLFGGAM